MKPPEWLTLDRVLKLAQIAALCWIAVELHDLAGMRADAEDAPQTAASSADAGIVESLQSIAESLDQIASRIASR